MGGELNPPNFGPCGSSEGESVGGWDSVGGWAEPSSAPEVPNQEFRTPEAQPVTCWHLSDLQGLLLLWFTLVRLWLDSEISPEISAQIRFLEGSSYTRIAELRTHQLRIRLAWPYSDFFGFEAGKFSSEIKIKSRKREGWEMAVGVGGSTCDVWDWSSVGGSRRPRFRQFGAARENLCGGSSTSTQTQTLRSLDGC